MCCPRLHIMRWVAVKLGRSKMHMNCTAVHMIMNPAEENGILELQLQCS